MREAILVIGLLLARRVEGRLRELMIVGDTNERFTQGKGTDDSYYVWIMGLSH